MLLGLKGRTFFQQSFAPPSIGSPITPLGETSPKDLPCLTSFEPLKIKRITLNGIRISDVSAIKEALESNKKQEERVNQYSGI